MTDTAKNNLMHNIQTGLLTLCTSAAIGCFILLWNLNNFATTQTEKNKEYEQDIITLTNQFNLIHTELDELEKENNQHETRISVLETKK